jgi:hypothetical protein
VPRTPFPERNRVVNSYSAYSKPIFETDRKEDFCKAPRRHKRAKPQRSEEFQQKTKLNRKYKGKESAKHTFSRTRSRSSIRTSLTINRSSRPIARKILAEGHGGTNVRTHNGVRNFNERASSIANTRGKKAPSTHFPERNRGRQFVLRLQ